MSVSGKHYLSERGLERNYLVAGLRAEVSFSEWNLLHQSYIEPTEKRLHLKFPAYTSPYLDMAEPIQPTPPIQYNADTTEGLAPSPNLEELHCATGLESISNLTSVFANNVSPYLYYCILYCIVDFKFSFRTWGWPATPLAWLCSINSTTGYIIRTLYFSKSHRFLFSTNRIDKMEQKTLRELRRTRKKLRRVRRQMDQMRQRQEAHLEDQHMLSSNITTQWHIDLTDFGNTIGCLAGPYRSSTV